MNSGKSCELTKKLITMLLAFQIVACSGGGSSSGGAVKSDEEISEITVPSAATLSWKAQQTKQFLFSWSDVAGATEYRLLENQDGVSGYSRIASIDPGIESYRHTVFLPDRVNASYLLQACNSAGCNDSLEVFVSGNLSEAVGYVKASNTGFADLFGTSLALSKDGTTMAVGTHREDSAATGIDGVQFDDNAEDSGAVYIFVKNGDSWMQQAYLKASNAEENDQFGGELSMSDDGNTLVVGGASGRQ